MRGPDLAELTEEVTARAGRLDGPLEAAALVESVRTADGSGRPVPPDVAVELGIAVFEQQMLDREAARRAADAERARRIAWPRHERPPPLAGLPLLPDRRTTALIASTVVALAGVCMATLPLWAGPNARPARATAVGLGAVASLLLAGGFAFVMERSTAGWISPSVAVRRAARIALVWAAAAVSVSLALRGLLRVLPVVPGRQAGWTLFAALFLSVVWMALSLGGVIARARWRPRIRARPVTRRPSVPSVLTWFGYGLALVSLLLADRVLAWAGTPHQRPLHLWFRSDYELAVGWALAGALPGFLVVATSARRLGRLLVAATFTAPLAGRDQVASHLEASYRRAVEWLTLTALVGGAAAGTGLLAVGRVVPWVHHRTHPDSLAVLGAAAFGYWLVAWGLLNQALAFRLARHRFALWAILPAVLADLAVGIALGHFVGYRLAVGGLVAGAAVLCALSTRFALALVRDADYFFYAAF